MKLQLTVLAILIGFCAFGQSQIPTGFINWLQNKTVQRSGIFVDGLTVPHGNLPSLNGHPRQSGALYWSSNEDKLYAYDSAKARFILVGGDSLSTGGGGGGQPALYKTVITDGTKSILPVYTYGYTVTSINTQTIAGSAILYAKTLGDTTYIKYSAPFKDTAKYVFNLDPASLIGGVTIVNPPAGEFITYQTASYTLNVNNGLVQNLVFDLSANATLTLPTPTNNTTVYIANMTSFTVTTSLPMYSVNSSSATTITNRRCRIVWAALLQKWYVLQD